MQVTAQWVYGAKMTSNRRRIDVDTTSFLRHVPARRLLVPVLFIVDTSNMWSKFSKDEKKRCN